MSSTCTWFDPEDHVVKPNILCKILSQCHMKRLHPKSGWTANYDKQGLDKPGLQQYLKHQNGCQYAHKLKKNTLIEVHTQNRETTLAVWSRKKYRFNDWTNCWDVCMFHFSTNLNCRPCWMILLILVSEKFSLLSPWLCPPCHNKWIIIAIWWKRRIFKKILIAWLIDLDIDLWL